ncbi:MAG TPA: hypothetical protein VK066_08985 [Chloroflexota bacterium]|nr:hypothetical protein [Chloroflexota bacterium]
MLPAPDDEPPPAPPPLLVPPLDPDEPPPGLAAPRELAGDSGPGLAVPPVLVVGVVPPAAPPGPPLVDALLPAELPLVVPPLVDPVPVPAVPPVVPPLVDPVPVPAVPPVVPPLAAPVPLLVAGLDVPALAPLVGPPWALEGAVAAWASRPALSLALSRAAPAIERISARTSCKICRASSSSDAARRCTSAAPSGTSWPRNMSYTSLPITPTTMPKMNLNIGGPPFVHGAPRAPGGSVAQSMPSAGVLAVRAMGDTQARGVY